MYQASILFNYIGSYRKWFKCIILDIIRGIMDEHEKLLELSDKASKINSTMKNVSFRMRRTRRSIEICKETCQQTNKIINDISKG